MSAALAFSRRPDAPISFRSFQLGQVCLNAFYESEPSPRRYHVREWQPSDGGMAGWKFRRNRWVWSCYAPRFAGEFITIVRLDDGAIAIAPRRWWACDPRGMPIDTDWWAERAWRVIEIHYEAQRDWYFGPQVLQ